MRNPDTRPRSRWLTTPALAGIMLLGGCSEPPPDPQQTASPEQTATTSPTATPTPSATPTVDPAAADWVGKVCSAAHPLPPPQTTLTINSSFAESDRATLIGHLTALRDTFRQPRTTLAGLRPAPISGGDELIAVELRALDKILDKLTDYLGKAQVYPPGEGLRSLFTLAQVDAVTWVGDEAGVRDVLDRHPDLAAAYEQRC